MSWGSSRGKVEENQDSSRKGAKALRNVKQKSFLSLATFAHFAPPRETGLPCMDYSAPPGGVGYDMSLAPYFS